MKIYTIKFIFCMFVFVLVREQISFRGLSEFISWKCSMEEDGNISEIRNYWIVLCVK